MKDAHKNFIEMETDTLQDTNVLYATIITTLNEQLKEAKKQKQKVIALIKDGRFVESLKELEND